MTTSLAVIFWLSVALLGYAYGGYALIVYVAARLRPAPDTLGDAPLPFVSLIISVPVSYTHLTLPTILLV